MPEEMSLEKEKLYEWVADNLDQFIEGVETILHNDPNRFVPIKEIAKELNWPFEGYKELKWICSISTCSLEYSCDNERLEYKYKGEITFADECWNRDIKREYEKLRREYKELRKQYRFLVLKELRAPRRIRKHEEQDRLLRSLNEQLGRTRREEIEMQRKGF